MAKAPSAFGKLKASYVDIERLITQGERLAKDVVPVDLQKKIVAQVNEEYDLAYPYNEAKRLLQLRRLKLYNNQRREPADVGDPLMFTTFNTIHATLYEDRLMAQWEGRGGEDDEDVEDNLNALADFDYDVMGKNETDYDWNWDAEFFGRALLLLMDFDRTKGIMAPVPEVMDAAAWIRDPRASSVNGNMQGAGAMRFGGWEFGMTYWEMKERTGFFNLGVLRKEREIKSIMQQASEARDEAQGRDYFPARQEALSKYGNYEFNMLNWLTTIRGKKYLVTLGNRRGTLHRLVEIKGNRWPIIDRALYPMSHDWDGVCIPDLTEDKQRARSMLINLANQSARSDVTPQYLFDRTRIKNLNDLNWRRDKFISVDGRVDNSVMPMQKSTMHQHVNIVLDLLDTAAQRATGATELRQGIQPGDKRTLGEQQLAAQAGDVRFGMSAKVYGWSEKAFWRQWYQLYKQNFKDEIDEKVVRVQGALAPIWRPLTRENIISDVDPDVKIESRIISEAKKARQLTSAVQVAGLALQDPENNRRFIQKFLAKMSGMTREQIDMAFPATVDELQAEQENEMLNAGKLPKIGIQDDHRSHIAVHAKAVQNAQSAAHIRQHKKLMVTKRNRPDLFPMPQAPGFNMPGQKAISPQNPQGASMASQAPAGMV